jgi:hypothetical protein
MSRRCKRRRIRRSRQRLEDAVDIGVSAPSQCRFERLAPEGFLQTPEQGSDAPRPQRLTQGGMQAGDAGELRGALGIARREA